MIAVESTGELISIVVMVIAFLIFVGWIVWVTNR